VECVLGLARRLPEVSWPKAEFATDAATEILDAFRDHAGIGTAPLTPVG